MSKDYQICTRCVMDTTDPEITFDENGVCNHCRDYDAAVAHRILAVDQREQILATLVKKVKEAGKGKSYDCIIGVSGGVDSTYVAYKVKELGLRPLAVHLDNGWDTELAVKNIEITLNNLGIDLFTRVLDWQEFKNLQIAFLKASTPDAEIPSDHAIFATLCDVAEQHGIKYIITGVNVRTESHMPRSWSQGHQDWRYIRSINAQFGKMPLTTYPHQNFYTYYRRFLTLRKVDILNYIDYSKMEAMGVLSQLGWRYYGGKHYESIYTRFYQGYILPIKFGYDKRRSHLSSLICSGEITRSNALSELDKPTYDPRLQEEDREYVVKKLGISDDKFEEIMRMPPKSFWDYPSYGNFWRQPLMRVVFSKLKWLYQAKVKKY